MKNKDRENIVTWAKEVLAIEAEALSRLSQSVDRELSGAVEIMDKCRRGRIIATGMGKAGIIAQKFSATIASFGFSSFWIHPADAVHGDLGRIKRDDVVLVLSYSGETDEIKNLIPFIKKIGAGIIAMTGNQRSNLARYADATINVKVDREACVLGLAPTTSTTAMLAICDAIAVSLQKLRGLAEKDFAFFHPRGSIGRKLLLRVCDIMRRTRFNPVVSANLTVKQVLKKITASRAGAASIVDKDGKLIGIFTDGDLRRNLLEDPRVLNRKVKEVMTENPTVIYAGDLASAALKVLEDNRIDEVPVIDDDGKCAGMLDVQDLIAAGLL